MLFSNAGLPWEMKSTENLSADAERQRRLVMHFFNTLQRTMVWAETKSHVPTPFLVGKRQPNEKKHSFSARHFLFSFRRNNDLVKMPCSSLIAHRSSPIAHCPPHPLRAINHAKVVLNRCLHRLNRIQWQVKGSLGSSLWKKFNSFDELQTQTYNLLPSEQVVLCDGRCK